MKVKELITLLKEYDGELEVAIKDADYYGDISYYPPDLYLTVAIDCGDRWEPRYSQGDTSTVSILVID